MNGFPLCRGRLVRVRGLLGVRLVRRRGLFLGRPVLVLVMVLSLPYPYLFKVDHLGSTLLQTRSSIPNLPRMTYYPLVQSPRLPLWHLVRPLLIRMDLDRLFGRRKHLFRRMFRFRWWRVGGWCLFLRSRRHNRNGTWGRRRGRWSHWLGRRNR